MKTYTCKQFVLLNDCGKIVLSFRCFRCFIFDLIWTNFKQLFYHVLFIFCFFLISFLMFQRSSLWIVIEYSPVESEKAKKKDDENVCVRDKKKRARKEFNNITKCREKKICGRKKMKKSGGENSTSHSQIHCSINIHIYIKSRYSALLKTREKEKEKEIWVKN